MAWHFGLFWATQVTLLANHVTYYNQIIFFSFQINKANKSNELRGKVVKLVIPCGTTEFWLLFKIAGSMECRWQTFTLRQPALSNQSRHAVLKHMLYIFPRTLYRLSFPALGTGYLISRAIQNRGYVVCSIEIEIENCVYVKRQT